MFSSVSTHTRRPLTANNPGERPRIDGTTASEQIRFAIGRSSLGFVLVASSATGICAILLGDDQSGLVRDLRDAFPSARLVADDLDLGTLDNVVRFIEAPARDLDLPLDLRGTPFQKQVWRRLRGVPAGTTVTYGEIATRIGAPREAYAVGEACASNLIAVAVPCHRVVRKNGTLAGYRWGFRRKRALLAREAAQ